MTQSKLNSCKFLAASALGIATFIGCGDENTTNINETVGISQLAKDESFPECSNDNAGEMLFAADSGKVYYCADGSWSTLNGTDGVAGSVCIAEALKDSSGYTIICDGDTVGTLKNGAAGADGKNGEDGNSCSAEILADSTGYSLTCDGKFVGTILNGIDGANGKDGSSCTAKSTETGFDLVCGGETVASISNGKNGAKGQDGESCTIADAETGYKITCGKTTVTVKNGTDGNPGEDGTGCELNDNNDGTVTVVCGENKTVLYKAMCGTTAYDPTAQFCSDGALYDLCDGKSYSPATEFCANKVVYSCKEYDCVSTENLNQTMLAAGKYGVLVDTRDNQLYRTIEIGEQTWMAQNLNYEYNEGSANSYCYENAEDNCKIYGRLYTWSAAMDSAVIFSENGKNCGYGTTCETAETVRGICPEGWHLPTTDEFGRLNELAGGNEVAGIALKSTSGWNENGNGTDKLGFNALSAGGRYWNGESDFEGFRAYFWSASEIDELNADGLGLYYNLDIGRLDHGGKNNPISIRCLKD